MNPNSNISNYMKKILFLLFFLSLSVMHAQDYFPTDAGVKTVENTVFAFTNANIYVTHDEVIKKGTLFIKDGKVISIGKSIKLPPRIDLSIFVPIFTLVSLIYFFDFLNNGFIFV